LQPRSWPAHFRGARWAREGKSPQAPEAHLAHAIPPERIGTDLFVLRRWSPSDASRFKQALDSSLVQLREWIPWALDEPSSLDVLEERLSRFHSDFVSGGDALYAILDPLEREVLGGVGLYRRVGQGAVEIGYWIRSDLTGRGLATRAAAELTDVARSLSDVSRVEIHCDPRNGASVAIPRKLGYRHRETRRDGSQWPDGNKRDLMIWELDVERNDGE
jgi:RimJ/RimL family protein N-acetyltransferase